jgi:hypothetical protein
MSARPLGLLDYGRVPAPSPKPQSLLSIALRGKLHPETLADVLGKDRQLPLDSAETLGQDRAARIKQLTTWLMRFPAYMWMNKQPEIRAGLEAFRRVQQKRKADPKFSDDLALFRYWGFAVFAVMILNSRPLVPSLAHERQKAVAAARLLGEMALRTALLRDAGVGYPESSGFLTALGKLEALAALKRRNRTDAFTPDREYVKNLTWHAMQVFGDAPPSLVYELASLKVSNPDKVAITRQVSDYKKGLQPKP